MLRNIKIEIKRLHDDINEYINTVNGFEHFISESVLFINDRDKLLSSHLLNTHKNRIMYLKLIIDRIASYSTSSLIGQFRNNFLKHNSEIISSVLDIDKSIDKNVNTMLQNIPDYIQNINEKIVSLIQYKKTLEDLKSTIVIEINSH
jgi:hypothetical protein